jgi:hypothetical protein
MSAASRRSPFEGTDRLVIDGTNLLHRLGAGAGGAAPASAVVGRLRAAVPAAIAIDLVFDGVGHGVHGRLAQRMLVRWSGRRPADDTILDLVSETALEGTGPVAAARVLVVTDDRALRDRVAAKGARTAPLGWLVARLDVPGPVAGERRGGTGRATPIGQGRPPAGASARGGADGRGPAGPDEEQGARWKPGRGATAKTGAPKRIARHKRKPRTGW